MLRGLGAVASQARAFSQQSWTAPKQLRSVATKNTILPFPCVRTLSTSSFPPSTSLRLTNQRPSNRPPTTRHSSTTTTPTESEPEPHPHDALPPETPKPYYNPHKAKRHWPPDMTKLSEKQQFRIERKYRRRAKLKYARPRWMKFTKLVQWGFIAFTIVYAALFLEWDVNDKRGNPFESFRKSFFEGANSLFTRPTGTKQQQGSTSSAGDP
ncbi:hypothetical protein FQN54_000281 [Arachnomyces sp. PD_36]|nr:hypothetical protein FQN54_000281 [Arachnomyces sp. PD_36]